MKIINNKKNMYEAQKRYKLKNPEKCKKWLKDWGEKMYLRLAILFKSLANGDASSISGISSPYL